MRTPLFIAAATAVFFCMHGQAFANAVNTTIVNKDGQPAHLSKCWVYWTDTQWHLGPTFINDQPTTLKAVKIRFVFKDAFGDVKQTNDVTDGGTYSTGVPIEDAWSVGIAHMPGTADVHTIDCSIVETMDMNGALWKSPDADTPVKPASS